MGPAPGKVDHSVVLVEQEATTAQVVTSAAPTARPVPYHNLWQRIASQLTYHDIDNERVARERARYLSEPDYLAVVSERARPYLYHIVEQVEERDMPMEIALLPAVESSFNAWAYSPDHAAGLWQIIPSTADHLGLERNWWYDGRRDLQAATTTALDYLTGLHEDLGEDWLVALAAYNSGKGRVLKERRKNRRRGQGDDFWSLDLPRETRAYVPRLLALSSILASPETWGVSLPELPNQPAFTEVRPEGQIELARAASLAGTDLASLRALNPGYLRWATPPADHYTLLVPVGAGARFSEGLTQLAPEQRVQWYHYQIERGDTLSDLARAFRTDVGAIMAVNGLMNTRIRAGDSLLIPRGEAYASSLAMAETGSTSRRLGYRVRSGDSLYRIAGRFNVTIGEIVQWNSLDPGKYLQPGQRLTLYVDDR
jgi:membrane-bound lytic murein transglycosylase D